MDTSELRNAPYNPRKITDEALAGLARSITEYGDLSGIVWNKTSGNLVCGHARLRAIREKYGDLPIEDGCITLPTGERFAVRVVEWDERTERAANISANSQTIQGTWTPDLFPLLEEIKLDTPDIFDTLHFDALYTMPFSAIEGADEERPQKQPKPVTCPHCGQSFTP